MKTLIQRATELANDIDEYAPNTNIALMMRELIDQVVFLENQVIKLSLESFHEQVAKSKNPTKSR
jgi:hypothetical protein